jgi:26S proteasome regulatory subunit N9
MYLYILISLFTLHRLWHQLTLKIIEFFKEPESASFQVRVFQNFVAEWESKINKLSLVSIALQAASQFKGK